MKFKNSIVISQMNDSIKSLNSDLDQLIIGKDQLQDLVICLKIRLEKAKLMQQLLKKL